MKNKIVFFLLLGILTSCSSDSDSDNNQINDNYKVSKIVYPNDQYVMDFLYNYNSEYCNQILYGGTNYLINYNYENNQLIDSYRNDNHYEYFYQNDNIVEITIKYGWSGLVSEKYIYTYNASNQISKVENYFNQNGALTFTSFVNYFYDSNGNNYRRDTYSSDSTLLYYQVFTFDNKNNPFKNFEPKISLMEYYPFGNNVTSISHFSANGTLNEITTYTHQYNSNEFPSKTTISDSNTSFTYSRDYFYEL